MPFKYGPLNASSLTVTGANRAQVVIDTTSSIPGRAPAGSSFIAMYDGAEGATGLPATITYRDNGAGLRHDLLISSGTGVTPANVTPAIEMWGPDAATDNADLNLLGSRLTMTVCNPLNGFAQNVWGLVGAQSGAAGVGTAVPAGAAYVAGSSPGTPYTKSGFITVTAAGSAGLATILWDLPFPNGVMAVQITSAWQAVGVYFVPNIILTTLAGVNLHVFTGASGVAPVSMPIGNAATFHYTAIGW